MDISYMNRKQIEAKMEQLAATAEVRFVAGFLLGCFIGAGMWATIAWAVNAWAS